MQIKNLTPINKYRYLKEQTDIQFISGKYFIGNEEIKDISYYLMNFENGILIKKASDIEELKKLIIAGSNLKKGKWPECNLIKEVYTMTERKKAPFVLSPKALLLGGLLLFAKDLTFVPFIYGVGGSGKSTFLNIMQQLFDNDFSKVKLSEFSDKFRYNEIMKHRINIGDECGDTTNIDALKEISTIDYLITIEDKFETPYTTIFQGRCIFSCNNIPHFVYTDTGLTRRIIFFDYGKKIKNPNTKIETMNFTKDELLGFAQEMYIAYNKAVQKYGELNDILKIEEFRSETVNAFVRDDDTVLQYIKANDIHIDDLDWFVNKYDEYTSYCNLMNNKYVKSKDNYLASIEYIKENISYLKNKIMGEIL